MDDYYILIDKKAVPTDMATWAKELERVDSRKVADDTIGDAWVSNVFLGLDHQFGEGPPLLFETLVFDGELDGEMDRYATWEEAEKGHAEMVKRVKHA